MLCRSIVDFVAKVPGNRGYSLRLALLPQQGRSLISPSTLERGRQEEVEAGRELEFISSFFISLDCRCFGRTLATNSSITPVVVEVVLIVSLQKQRLRVEVCMCLLAACFVPVPPPSQVWA